MLASLFNAGKGGDTHQALSPAPQSHHGQKLCLSSASAAASPVATPMQSVAVADKNTSDAVQALSSKGDTAAGNSDSPITPLQADSAYPQRHTYTPSESGPSTGANPSTGPDSVAKHAQQGAKGESGGQTQPALEGRFDQVNRDVADSVNESNSSASLSEQSLRQQQSAVGTTDDGGTGGHVQAQLSPPQSCPSTPASQIGTNGIDEAYQSVTHMNSCFAKSDDEGQHDDTLSSSRSSQLVNDNDKADATPIGQHNDEEVQSSSMSVKPQSRSYELNALPKAKAKAQVNTAAFHTYIFCKAACCLLHVFC